MIGAKAGTKLGGYPGVPQPSAQQAQQQQAKQQDWARTLEANSAGAATNAEDFTKQFMSDMFGGGAAQPNRTSSPMGAGPRMASPAASAPQPSQPRPSPMASAPAPSGQANWGKTLDADKAGAADNAADFTKQFMAQMYGGGHN